MHIYDNEADNELLAVDSLMEEAPIGWSSTCLDQTLFYYLECDNSDTQTDDLSNDK